MYKSRTKRSLFSFFHTEAGRKVVFVGATGTALGLFCVNFIPHTIGLRYYRDFMQCYKNGIERPVPEHVEKRLEIAYDQLDVHAYERKITKPFTVVGFDLFQAGSTKYRFGGLLGIPVNYDYSSVDDIDRKNIRFRDQKLNWNSESGQLLQNAIILSEDEQIFGLCKCILQLQTHRLLWNAIFPTANFLMIYAVGSYLNTRLNLHAGPLSLRLVLYSILSLFGLGCWSFMKDYTQVLYDSHIDKKLSSMGPRFVEAGISFYDKQLQKNMALRALLKDDTYTAKGNVNYLLRQKSLPLTIRKSFFEEKWKEIQNSTEEPETELVS